MDFYKQFPESRLNLLPEFEDLIVKFDELQITTHQLLITSPVEISMIYGLNVGMVDKFVKILRSEGQKVKLTSFFDEHLRDDSTGSSSPKQKESFSTGDKTLDDLLNGGIHFNEVTEVFGEASTGKSQLMMQLANSVQRDGHECVYVSTEGQVETRRLRDFVAFSRPTENSDAAAVGSHDEDGAAVERGMHKVYVINCNDLDTQEHILQVQLPTLLAHNPRVKLVILDSISHHIRVELGLDFQELKNYLNDLGSRLNKLCHDYGIAIVLTNQMSFKPPKTILNSDYKKIHHDYQIGWLNGFDDESIIQRQSNVDENNGEAGFRRPRNNGIATLGLDWDKFMSVKILLLKKYKLNKDEVESFKKSKRLELLKMGIDNNMGKLGDKINNRDDGYMMPSDYNQQNSNNELQGLQITQEEEAQFWELKRFVKIVFSPRCPPSNETEFKISKGGITTTKQPKEGE